MKIRASGLLGATTPVITMTPAMSAPAVYRATTCRTMYCRQLQARAMLAAIWVRPCSTMAGARGTKVSRRFIRIMPPAIPNSPDRNAVATIRAPRAAIVRGVIGRYLRRSFSLAPLLRGEA